MITCYNDSCRGYTHSVQETLEEPLHGVQTGKHLLLVLQQHKHSSAAHNKNKAHAVRRWVSHQVLLQFGHHLLQNAVMVLLEADQLWETRHEEP